MLHYIFFLLSFTQVIKILSSSKKNTTQPPSTISKITNNAIRPLTRAATYMGSMVGGDIAELAKGAQDLEQGFLITDKFVKAHWEASALLGEVFYQGHRIIAILNKYYTWKLQSENKDKNFFDYAKTAPEELAKMPKKVLKQLKLIFSDPSIIFPYSQANKNIQVQNEKQML